MELSRQLVKKTDRIALNILKIVNANVLESDISETFRVKKWAKTNLHKMDLL